MATKEIVKTMTDKWFEGYARALNSGLSGEVAVTAVNEWFEELLNPKAGA
jgi:hypothetical protein